jgi:hypothetical protein
MVATRIFISYKHEAPWVAMADKFAIKLRNYGDDELDCYIDSEGIVPGFPWRVSVDAALAQCTHMVCLLCDSYWESVECRRELDHLLRRRAQGEPVAPYFVRAEPIAGSRLKLAPGGLPIGDVSRAGDFEFLGPKNEARQLLSMLELEERHWGGAIEKMIERLLKAPR